MLGKVSNFCTLIIDGSDGRSSMKETELALGMIIPLGLSNPPKIRVWFRSEKTIAGSGFARGFCAEKVRVVHLLAIHFKLLVHSMYDWDAIFLHHRKISQLSISTTRPLQLHPRATFVSLRKWFWAYGTFFVLCTYRQSPQYVVVHLQLISVVIKRRATTKTQGSFGTKFKSEENLLTFPLIIRRCIFPMPSNPQRDHGLCSELLPAQYIAVFRKMSRFFWMFRCLSQTQNRPVLVNILPGFQSHRLTTNSRF